MITVHLEYDSMKKSRLYRLVRWFLARFIGCSRPGLYFSDTFAFSFHAHWSTFQEYYVLIRKRKRNTLTFTHSGTESYHVQCLFFRGCRRSYKPAHLLLSTVHRNTAGFNQFHSLKLNGRSRERWLYSSIALLSVCDRVKRSRHDNHLRRQRPYSSCSLKSRLAVIYEGLLQ